MNRDPIANAAASLHYTCKGIEDLIDLLTEHEIAMEDLSEEYTQAVEEIATCTEIIRDAALTEADLERQITSLEVQLSEAEEDAWTTRRILTNLGETVRSQEREILELKRYSMD